jgi:hypothetical protein
MNVHAVDRQENKRPCESCALVAIVESLRGGESDQTSGGEIGEIRRLVVSSAVLRPSESRQHHVLVSDSMQSTVSFDLLGVNYKKR